MLTAGIERVLVLRPEGREDAAFVRAIFESSEPAWAFLPLTGACREQLVTRQLAAREAEWRRARPRAVRRVILVDGERVGRLVVDRGDPLHVVHLAFFTEHRGRGLGTRVLEAEMARAAQRHVPVTAWSSEQSPAVPLYERLGWHVIEHSGPHMLWRWQLG